jgi:nucleotide-binding universal stress UspA family protein
LLPFRKILCPTDFSEPSYAALKDAGELAGHFSAELLVIHVMPPVPVPYPYPEPPVYPGFDVASYQQEMTLFSQNALKEVVAQKVSPQVCPLTTVVIGDAAQEIIRLAEQEQVDLIVIATHGQSGWRYFVFGSVAEKVVRLAPCPVLTIRAPQEEKK